MILNQFNVPSASLKADISVYVLLPDCITADMDTIYLLHGAMEEPSVLLSKSTLSELADHYQTAVILPAMGNGFYVDAAHEFLCNELVKYIQKEFALSLNREHTLIGGNSMGGYGALYNGMKRPDIFGAVFSLSGALDLSYGITFVRYLDAKLPDYLNKPKAQLISEYDLVPLLSNQSKQQYYLSCGKDDFLIDINRKFVSILNQNNIAYTYVEEAGNHDWDYWRKALVNVFEWNRLRERYVNSI